VLPNLLIKVFLQDTTDGLPAFKLVTLPKMEKTPPFLYLDLEIKLSSSGNFITTTLMDFMDNLKNP
jgi:hypothetical protein